MRRRASLVGCATAVLTAALAAAQSAQPSIHEAAARGDIAAVTRILDADPAALHARAGLFQTTALHEAARTDQAAIIDLLLARGADVNVKDRSLSTPLHAAVRAAAVESARRLVASGADLHAKDSGGATPLLAAAERGSRDGLALLVAAGADVNDVDATGQTALVTAIVAGHEALVEPLLAAGARPGTADGSGKTALHWAAERGRCSAVAGLLAKGAVVNARDRRSQTPLLLASAHGHLACIDALLAAGADINARNSAGLTPLDAAAVGDQREAAERLRAHGAELSVFAAAALGDLDALRRLVETDPGLVSARDSLQGTPLHWAAAHNRVQAVGFLLARGASVDDTMADETTALHLAAQAGAADAVQALLAAGADAARKTRAGKTADDLAAAARRDDVRAVLRRQVTPVPSATLSPTASTPSEPARAPASPRGSTPTPTAGATVAAPSAVPPAASDARRLGQSLEEVPRLLDDLFLRRMFPQLQAAGSIAPTVTADQWVRGLGDGERASLLRQARGPESRLFSYLGGDGTTYLRWTDGKTVKGDRLALSSTGALPPPDIVDAWLVGIVADVLGTSPGTSLETRFDAWTTELDGAILAEVFDALKRAGQIGQREPTLQEWIARVAPERKSRFIEAAKGPEAAFRWYERGGTVSVRFSAPGTQSEFVRLEFPAGTVPAPSAVSGWLRRIAHRLVVTCDLSAVLKGATPTHRLDVQPWHDLWDAIESADPAAVALILRYSPDEANAVGPQGRTALMHATLFDSPAVVDLLLKAGARVDARDDTMRTALHHAAGTSRLENVRLLVEHGAELEPVDREGRSPLHDAAFSGSPAVVRYLLEKGARGMLCDARNLGPLGHLDMRARLRWLTGEDNEDVHPLFGTERDIQEIRQLLVSRRVLDRCAR